MESIQNTNTKDYHHSLIENDNNNNNNNNNNTTHACGSIWLPDQKYVAKGFNSSINFVCDMNNLPQLFNTDPEVNQFVKEKVLLGAIGFAIHGEKPKKMSFKLSCASTTELAGSVVCGLSLYVQIINNSPAYFVKIFVSYKNSESNNNFSRRTIHVDNNSNSSQKFADDNSTEIILPLESNDISPLRNSFQFDIEYIREFLSSSSSSSNSTAAGGGDTKSSLNSLGSVVYLLRVRLIQKITGRTEIISPKGWDIEIPIELGSVVRLQGGNATIGVFGSGLIIEESAYKSNDPSSQKESEIPSSSSPSSPSSSSSSSSSCCFSFQVLKFEFKSKSALMSYPVASSFTSIRYPSTYARIEAMLSNYRSWMNLKLKYQLPSIFKIIFDNDSISTYERIFSMLMKVLY